MDGALWGSEHAYRLFVMPYNGQCFVCDKGMWMGRYGEGKVFTPCLSGNEHNTEVSTGNTLIRVS